MSKLSLGQFGGALASRQRRRYSGPSPDSPLVWTERDVASQSAGLGVLGHVGRPLSDVRNGRVSIKPCTLFVWCFLCVPTHVGIRAHWTAYVVMYRLLALLVAGTTYLPDFRCSLSRLHLFRFICKHCGPAVYLLDRTVTSFVEKNTSIYKEQLVVWLS